MMKNKNVELSLVNDSFEFLFSDLEAEHIRQVLKPRALIQNWVLKSEN